MEKHLGTLLRKVENDVFCRLDCKEQPDKHAELCRNLKLIYNSSNFSEFVPLQKEPFSEDGEIETCLCSKTNLKYSYLVKHKASDNWVCIGSECIKRFFPEMWLEIKNGRCLACDRIIPNKQTAISRSGYCHEHCYKKKHGVFPEGRYGRCKFCYENITGKSTRYKEDGYCGRKCFEKATGRRCVTCDCDISRLNKSYRRCYNCYCEVFPGG